MVRGRWEGFETVLTCCFLPSRLQNSTHFVLASWLEAFFLCCILSLRALFLLLPWCCLINSLYREAAQRECSQRQPKATNRRGPAESWWAQQVSSAAGKKAKHSRLSHLWSPLSAREPYSCKTCANWPECFACLLQGAFIHPLNIHWYPLITHYLSTTSTNIH